MQVNRLQRIEENKYFHYMKKTRPKSYKIQKGRSRERYRKAEAVWVCNRTSLQKHTFKKKKKKEENGGKKEKKKDKECLS